MKPIGPGTTRSTAANIRPAAERETLARLLLASVALDSRSDDEISTELKSRLTKLQSGEDPGRSFEEVFGEPLLS